jgi:hypothetical protein
MMAKKRVALVLLGVLLILISCTSAYARWSNTSDITIDLSISNGCAVLSAYVAGYSGTTKITATAVLERKNSNGTYTEIEKWTNISSNSTSLGWTATRYVTKGYTYRFTFTPTVYRNGTGETVSASKSTNA